MGVCVFSWVGLWGGVWGRWVVLGWVIMICVCDCDEERYVCVIVVKSGMRVCVIVVKSGVCVCVCVCVCACDCSGCTCEIRPRHGALCSVHGPALRRWRNLSAPLGLLPARRNTDWVCGSVEAGSCRLTLWLLHYNTFIDRLKSTQSPNYSTKWGI